MRETHQLGEEPLPEGSESDHLRLNLTYFLNSGLSWEVSLKVKDNTQRVALKQLQVQHLGRLKITESDNAQEVKKNQE